MRRTLTAAVGITLASCLFSTAPAEVHVDEALINTSQIVSRTNNPFFPAGRDVAAINLSFGVAAGGTINGIGFHDLDMNANPQIGEGIVVLNSTDGITFDFNFTCMSDCPGNRGLDNAGIAGPDAEVANRIAQGNRYLTVPTGNHAPNIITFHGLAPSTPVYVQLIGGQHNWGDSTTVYVNGDRLSQDSGTLIGQWTSNTTDRTAGLFAFDSDSDGAGDLTVSFQTTRFGGIAAILLHQELGDGDGDGLPDAWEIEHGLNPGNPGDANEDILDQDGLTNLEELENGTDPNDADSDDDGLLDGVEVKDLATNPLSADSDGDGLEDAVETNTGVFVHETNTGTDPNNPNTDGDPVDDGDEVAQDTDPNDPVDFALPVAVQLIDTIQLNPDESEVLAAVNMRFDAQPPGLGGTVHGATFEDVIWGTETTLTNGVTVLGTVAGDVRTANTVKTISGEGEDIVENVANSINFYNVDTDGTLTLGNLPPGLPVRAHLITGDAASFFNNWAGIFSLTAIDTTNMQASEIFSFQAGTEPVNTDARLAIFDTTVDSGGKLQLGIDQTVAGQHAGIGGIVLLEAPGASNFNITDISFDAKTGHPTITWHSRPGRTYAVEAATGDLEVWIELDDGVGSGGEVTSFTDPAATPDTAGRVYYRVRRL